MLTPFDFCNNNPILHIDPDGIFLLDVHQRITKNALKRFNISLKKDTKFSREIARQIISVELNSEIFVAIRGNDTTLPFLKL